MDVPAIAWYETDALDGACDCCEEILAYCAKRTDVRILSTLGRCQHNKCTAERLEDAHQDDRVLPTHIDAAAHEQLHAAQCGAGYECRRGAPRQKPSHVQRVEAVHVLRGVHGLREALRPLAAFL